MDITAELRAALGGSTILVDPTETAPYLVDQSGVESDGFPLAVLLAANTQDVAEALRWASRHRIRTVVRGGGSGVSGGAVAYSGGLVISTERMSRILEINVADRIAIVEPGVVIDDLDAAAARLGFMYAPDPVSSNIATLGGSIATNAGGFRCLAHGVTSDSVGGLEVVLADGRIVQTGGRTRKNATGYDLTKLFVGSEGSLGVVTKAIVRLKPIPRGESVTFRASFATTGDAGTAVAAVMAAPLNLELLELLDHATLEIVESFHPTGIRLDGGAMLIGVVIAVDVEAQIEEIRATCTRAGCTIFEIAADTSLLEARRMTKPALLARGLTRSCDAAVPPSRLAELLDEIERIGVRYGRTIATVAHAGDGNIHATVESGEEFGDIEVAEQALHDIVLSAIRLGGVISGEHGIGSTKVDLLEEQFDGDTLELQRSIKELLDPLNILAPGRAI